jgi:hypothetical protein
MHKVFKIYNLIICILSVGFVSMPDCTIAQTQRQQIINTALKFVNFKWTANQNNLWANVQCGERNVFSAPWVQVGMNTSVPYCWGGFMNVTKFNEDIQSGVSAGDVCSIQGGNCGGNGAGSTCAAGVDCSGFISICWGLTTKYGTEQLNNISIAYTDMSGLQPGDILNKPGHHVRLFYSRDSDTGLITVLESSGNGWNTSSNTYSLIALNGYQPRYYNEIGQK